MISKGVIEQAGADLTAIRDMFPELDQMECLHIWGILHTSAVLARQAAAVEEIADFAVFAHELGKQHLIDSIEMPHPLDGKKVSTKATVKTKASAK